MYSKTLLVLALAALPLAACGKKADTPPAKPATTTAPAKADAPLQATGFGVPECDNYLRLYLECIDSKVPEMVRGQVRDGFEQTRKAWQEIATTAEGRASLAAGCTQATEIARSAMAAYGCTF
jgi:hypothetical protein